MSEAEPSNPWDATFRRIRVVHRIDWVYPPKPRAAELDAVEQELEFKFPTSYRSFAEDFGLDGELLVLPRLLPLRKPIDDGWSVLGETQYLRQKHHEYWLLPPQPSPLFSRMVVFAEDGSYEKFVFDPAEVTDSRWHECRIYSIDKSAQITHLGDTFEEYLAWIYDRYHPDPEEADMWDDAGVRRWEVVKPDSSALDAIEYKRCHTGEKLFPEPEIVKLWLAFNNNAARDLARSIRDGHPDAFPVLADALEEAGCTNADLLDSCRTGDPDIDGVWVLRVLLGEG